MKKIIVLIITLLIAVLLCACTENGSQSSIPIQESSENSIKTEVSADTNEESVNESSDESVFVPEEVYEFLLSEYSVTSTREAFGTVYTSEYYFVDGAVAGSKLITAFPDKQSAEKYYEVILEDYPDAVIEELTVIHYMDDSEVYYYGYSLEKLKFILEKTGYEYTVNFDEDIYKDIYNEESDEE